MRSDFSLKTVVNVTNALGEHPLETYHAKNRKYSIRILSIVRAILRGQKGHRLPSERDTIIY